MYSIIACIICFVAGGYFFKAVMGWGKQQVEKVEKKAHDLEQKIIKK